MIQPYYKKMVVRKATYKKMVVEMVVGLLGKRSNQLPKLYQTNFFLTRKSCTAFPTKRTLHHRCQYQWSATYNQFGKHRIFQPFHDLALGGWSNSRYFCCIPMLFQPDVSRAANWHGNKTSTICRCISKSCPTSVEKMARSTLPGFKKMNTL